jgi:hypothetical protein
MAVVELPRAAAACGAVDSAGLGGAACVASPDLLCVHLAYPAIDRPLAPKPTDDGARSVESPQDIGMLEGLHRAWCHESHRLGGAACLGRARNVIRGTRSCCVNPATHAQATKLSRI